MRPIYYVGAFLAVSVAINIYLWWQKDPSCHSTPGYETPIEIPKDVADGYINQYRATLSESEVYGGILCRSAIDEILCTQNCNAIVYSFGVDSLGTTGPERKGVFLILTGAHVKINDLSGNVERVGDLGVKYYMPRNWCPTSCLTN